MALPPHGAQGPEEELTHPLRLHWEYLSYLFRKLPALSSNEELERGYRDFLQVSNSPKPPIYLVDRDRVVDTGRRRATVLYDEELEHGYRDSLQVGGLMHTPKFDCSKEVPARQHWTTPSGTVVQRKVQHKLLVVLANMHLWANKKTPMTFRPRPSLTLWRPLEQSPLQPLQDTPGRGVPNAATF